jgi:toxin ParE1/3/4
VRVHWTHTAIAHLLAIYEHIARDAPLYAQRSVDRLTRRSEQSAAFPPSGRVAPEYGAPDIREVIDRSSRMIDRSREEQIDVLAVVPSAQRLPPEPSTARGHRTSHCRGRGASGALQLFSSVNGLGWFCHRR